MKVNYANESNSEEIKELSYHEQSIILTSDAPLQKMNKNIYLALISCLLWGFADSLWDGLILSNYIFSLTNDNSKIGYYFATFGVS